MSESNYRQYVRLLLKLVAYEIAGTDDGQDAETLREQMVESWRLLTIGERKLVDELAEDLKEFRKVAL